MDPRVLITYGMFFKIPRLPPGKRILALRKVRERAEAYALDDLVRRCDRAIANARESRSRNSRWAARKSSRVLYTPGLLPIDNRTDVVITSIRDGALVQIQGADPGDPLVAEVEAFLAALFPEGVFGVTSLPFSEEIVAVEAMLELLQGAWADLVARLGLGRLVERLAGLAVAYRAELEQTASITQEDVEAGRVQGHVDMHEIVSMIFGMHNDSAIPDHVNRRADLLAPIIEQIEATRALRRRRRGQNAAGDEVDDVDDETDAGEGEDVDEAEGEEEDEVEADEEGEVEADSSTDETPRKA